METKDIIANNVLIAEFMGAIDGVPTESGERVLINVPDFYSNRGSTSTWLTTMLQYHKRWDWLMPVVEKIESLGYWVNRINGDVWIVNDNEEVIINNTNHKGGIEAYYNAVVEFIKWWNENK